MGRLTPTLRPTLSTSCLRSTSRRRSPRTTSRTASLVSPGMRRASATSSSTAERRISLRVSTQRLRSWRRVASGRRCSSKRGRLPERSRPRSRRVRARSRAAEPNTNTGEPGTVKREGAAPPGEGDGGDWGGAAAAAPAASLPVGTRPLIEAVGLGKDFGATCVLDGVNFRGERGEKVCIVGPSGSGKTTLLRCLNLLLEPTRGKLIHRGELLGDWPDRRPTIDLRKYRSRIGMVFQHFELFPHLTALNNIAL